MRRIGPIGLINDWVGEDRSLMGVWDDMEQIDANLDENHGFAIANVFPEFSFILSTCKENSLFLTEKVISKHFRCTHDHV